MTLGEKITTLRNQHEMSQGDLAEKMNVSRQSISKWETDASIPELDKLIMLSELFGITLDDLVKSEAIQEPTKETERENSEQPVQVVIQKTSNTRKIVGIILLCFGALIWLLLTVLGGFLGGLLFGSPFLLCGAICLIFKKNTGLWCAWALFLTVNLYLRYATGITWRLTLFTLNYEPSMNYTRLAFAWIELLCFVVMVIITILRFQKKQLVLDKRGKGLYIAGWVVLALLFIPVQLDPLSGLSNIRYMFLDWIKIGLFTTLVITTLRLIKTHKAKASEENHHNI